MPEGINEVDVDGFVAISKKIGADVVISRDRRVTDTKITKNECMTVVRQCQAESVKYSVLSLGDNSLRRMNYSEALSFGIYARPCEDINTLSDFVS